jgi:hypothetical protein
MGLILNTRSIISTILILFIIFDFLWKVLAIHINFLKRQIFIQIRVYNLFSLATIILLFNITGASFYLTW